MHYLVPFSTGLDLVTLGIGIYVILRLREWLHENYGFHALDTIITMIIVGNVVIMPLAAAGRILGVGEQYLYLIPMYCVIAYLSIVTIVFAARLLRIEGEMRGLKRPIAYVGIAISVCFLSFILIPIGVLLGAVYNLLIGLLLLQRPAEEVEYV